MRLLVCESISKLESRLLFDRIFLEYQGYDVLQYKALIPFKSLSILKNKSLAWKSVSFHFNYFWKGSWIMSLSRNRLRRKSPTSGRVLGPPMFNIKTPVLGGLSVVVVAVCLMKVLLTVVIHGRNCLTEFGVTRFRDIAILALQTNYGPM